MSDVADNRTQWTPAEKAALTKALINLQGRYKGAEAVLETVAALDAALLPASKRAAHDFLRAANSFLQLGDAKTITELLTPSAAREQLQRCLNCYRSWRTFLDSDPGIAGFSDKVGQALEED